MENLYLVSNFRAILLKIGLGLIFLLILFFMGSFLLSSLFLIYITGPLILLTLAISLKDIKYGTLFLIFLIPLLTPLTYQLGIHNFSMIEIIFLALLLVWLAKLILASGIKMAKTALDLPLFLYILIVIGSCITVLSSFHFIPGNLYYYKLAEFAKNIFFWDQLDSFFTIRAMITLLEGILFYLLIVNNIKSKDFVKNILMAILASSVVVSVYGIFQYFFKFNLIEYWVKVDPNITRINSTLPDVNSYASYLLLILFLAFNIFLFQRGKKKLLLGVMITLLGFNLIFTYSRIALATLFIALIINFILIYKVRLFTSFRSKLLKWQYKKILSGALVIVIVLFLILFSAAQLIKIPRQEQDSWLKIALFSLNMKNSFYTISKGRMVYWNAAIAMIKSHPIFGIGVGGFVWNLSSYINTSKYRIRPIENAHNYFLQMTSEMGLLFLGIYFLILAIAFHKAMSALKYMKDNFWKFISIGIVCGLIAFLLTCLTGHPLLLIEMQFIFWLFIAIIFALTQSVVPYRPSPNILKKVAIILAAGILFSIPVRAFFNYTNSPPVTNHGFHSWERWQDKLPFRWTKRVASQKLKIDGQTLYIPLISFHPSIAQEPLKVQIYLNGRMVDQVVIKDNLPHILNYPLFPTSNKSIVISYVTDKTWNPVKTKESKDWRNLGVVVGKVSWDKLPAEWRQFGGKAEYGFYHWEKWSDKLRFRWTKKKAHIRLPIGGDKLIIPMMCNYPHIDKNPQQVNIYINYSLLEKIVLQDTQWRDMEIKLPPQTSKEIILTFEAQRIWNPALLGISNDNRNIGIAVGEFRWILIGKNPSE